MSNAPPRSTETGSLIPVIIRGNGMFAFSAIYTGLLAHFASYSFIVAAAGPPVRG